MGCGPVGAKGPSAGSVEAGAPGGDCPLLVAPLPLPAIGGALFPWLAHAARMAGEMAGGGGRLEEQLPLSTLAFFLASSPEELDLSDLSSR
jgi:hypothetical protein